MLTFLKSKIYKAELAGNTSQHYTSLFSGLLARTKKYTGTVNMLNKDHSKYENLHYQIVDVYYDFFIKVVQVLELGFIAQIRYDGKTYFFNQNTIAAISEEASFENIKEKPISLYYCFTHYQQLESIDITHEALIK